MRTRTVAIVVPARNEERFIGRAVRSLLPRGDVPFEWRLTIADGMSEDATASIARGLEREDSRIRLVPNPRRLQGAAVNDAAAEAEGWADVLVQADAHAAYPPGFVAALVDEIDRSGASSVVVSMVSAADGSGWFAKATAAAQNGRIGNGGSAHRNATASRDVDHGHHAAFRVSEFRRIGGYDETFTHNFDAEFDRRLVLAGGRVRLYGGMRMTYFVRETPGALARQYWNHGQGRAKTVLKHRTAKIRQMLPVVVTAANAVAVAASPFAPAALLLPIVYLIACLAIGAATAQGDGAERLAGIPAAIMHHAWGAGFIAGVVRARS